MAESVSKPRAVRGTTKTAKENSTTGKTKPARPAKTAAKPIAEAVAEPAAKKTGTRKSAAAKASKSAAKPMLVKSVGVVMMPTAKTAPIPHEEIARLAYHYWQQRGSQHGNHHQDWERAERELRARAVQQLHKAS